jgi:phosphoglycerate dehydrogenase-like enzyme
LILCSIPRLTDKEKEQLSNIHHGSIHFVSDFENAEVAWEEVKIFITFGYDINTSLLKKLEALRWIHIFQTGIEHIPLKVIKDRNITLTHTKNIHGIPISEYVLSMILYTVRDLPRYLASKNSKYWDRREPFIEEANGKTAAIFGTGVIGKEIAKTLKSINLHIIGVNTTGHRIEHFDEVYSLQDKQLALIKSDFVVLIMPLTKDTYHCIGKEEFRIMKNNSYLINVGRGPLVDVDALIQALSTNQIKGAAIDVFEVEPLPVESPLWNLNNLFITPHIASLSNKYNERAIEEFESNYELFIQNKPLNYEITLNKAY